MRFRLLVDSEEFWSALEADIASSRERVWVQTLSLEGDRAGKRLAAALIACSASDRRVLVDGFTRWVQNDRFLYSPAALMDQELRSESRETRRMLRNLAAEGVATRWGAPLGFLARRAPWRSHRKLLVLDRGICYIGGFNFTEHNFGWHDLMLRIDDAEVSAFCARAFDRSWIGERESERGEFEGIAMLHIDPPDLSPYDWIWEVISAARAEIFVESAYITPPLSDALRGAARRGVLVRLVSPENNNVPLFRKYVIWEANRSSVKLRFLPGMTHMKAILVDGETLILGSSNLHFLGHRTQNENMAVVTDSNLVKEFIRRVAEPDWSDSVPFNGPRPRNGWAICAGMKTYMRLAEISGRGRSLPPRSVV